MTCKPNSLVRRTFHFSKPESTASEYILKAVDTMTVPKNISLLIQLQFNYNLLTTASKIKQKQFHCKLRKQTTKTNNIIAQERCSKPGSLFSSCMDALWSMSSEAIEVSHLIDPLARLKHLTFNPPELTTMTSGWNQSFEKVINAVKL